MLPVLAILAVLTVPTLGRSLDGRLPFIVNGNDVDFPGKYPYMASYQIFGFHYCGAAIISPKLLLTAAHCCPLVACPDDIFVVGAHDIKTMIQGQPTTYSLESTKRNPGYGNGTGLYESDICILKLTSDINMTNPYVDTINLPAVGSTEDFVGKNCTITGWGNTQIGSTDPANILQEASTTPLTLAACKAAVAGHPIIKESDVVASHICVGAQGSDKPGVCHGDSGSPLACPSSAGGKVLAGLAAWTDRTCDPQYPSAYTRITSFRDWIKENTGL